MRGAFKYLPLMNNPQVRNPTTSISFFIFFDSPDEVGRVLQHNSGIRVNLRLLSA
ncbi:MAG: hypothetical protein BWY08_00298 [Bacteroidetes bacterium ADurb.Bin174]|nr:MAG: hypothetical protein BWY08_00298 [Bacteroidetes bacterium ADurb.Bin174]